MSDKTLRPGIAGEDPVTSWNPPCELCGRVEWERKVTIDGMLIISCPKCAGSYVDRSFAEPLHIRRKGQERRTLQERRKEHTGEPDAQ